LVVLFVGSGEVVARKSKHLSSRGC
jgi:hypothetical protein